MVGVLVELCMAIRVVMGQRGGSRGGHAAPRWNSIRLRPHITATVCRKARTIPRRFADELELSFSRGPRTNHVPTRRTGGSRCKSASALHRTYVDTLLAASHTNTHTLVTRTAVAHTLWHTASVARARAHTHTHTHTHTHAYPRCSAMATMVLWSTTSTCGARRGTSASNCARLAPPSLVR